MPFPTLKDDGQTVTLDLHGASVDEAEGLALRAVAEARRRGRSSVRLIHGSSTTGGSRRTIKETLHELLREGRLGVSSANSHVGEDTLLISLGHAGRHDPRILTMTDLLR
ncbi:MAG: Smr/MutS family protein [Rhodothermales bacterium]|nr:Smr/MutS family protein [Rhodothermales bacterium]